MAEQALALNISLDVHPALDTVAVHLPPNELTSFVSPSTSRIWWPLYFLRGTPFFLIHAAFCETYFGVPPSFFAASTGVDDDCHTLTNSSFVKFFISSPSASCTVCPNRTYSILGKPLASRPGFPIRDHIGICISWIHPIIGNNYCQPNSATLALPRPSPQTQSGLRWHRR